MKTLYAAIALLALLAIGLAAAIAIIISAGHKPVERNPSITESAPAEETRSEYSRRRNLAMILYAMEYRGFDQQDLRVLDNAARRGGEFNKHSSHQICTWHFLSAAFFNWAVRLTVSQVEAGEPLQLLARDTELEWQMARRGYPDEVIDAGTQLLQEPLLPEPEFGKPVTIIRQAAGYNWEREIANINDPKNGPPKWRLSIKWTPEP